MQSAKLFFLAVLATLTPSQAIECMISPYPVTRIFDNILHFQSNKLPFSSVNPRSAGSSVKFSFYSINRLTKNMFVAYDSQHIERLDLQNKGIKYVDEGAFISLDCLQQLDLSHNNITKLSKDVFEGLKGLRRLDLNNNILTELPDMVFAHLRSLDILDLSKNQIKNIYQLSFFDLANLVVLNLESNELTTIVPDIFVSLRGLEQLNLAKNKLSEVRPEKWPNLKEMEVLNLAGNGLSSFDPSYNFSFSNLRSLNLSANSLTMLNVRELRRFLPKLAVIDLNDNPWFCDDLAAIIHQLGEFRISFPVGNNTVNEHGIACTEYSASTSRVTTETPSSTIDAQTPNSTKRHQPEVDCHKELYDKINYTQDLVIFLVVLVLFLIFFEIFLRAGFCKPALASIRNRDEYEEPNGEHFRLIR